MKKILLLFSILILFAGNVYTKVITTFLGIPIDGTKIEMKRKLVAKGFRYVKGEDFLRGEFNGTEVNLFVVTNKNKVWRIMVVNDEPIKDISQVKIKYNSLIKQFNNSEEKYYPVDDEKDYTIPENEDIWYKLNLDSGYYTVSYFQLTKIKSDSPTEDLFNRIVSVSLRGSDSIGYGIFIYYDNLYNQAHGEDL